MGFCVAEDYECVVGLDRPNGDNFYQIDELKMVFERLLHLKRTHNREALAEFVKVQSEMASNIMRVRYDGRSLRHTVLKP